MKSRNQIIISFAISVSLLLSVSCTTNNTSHSAKESEHSNQKDHLAKVNEQGDNAMGFSHKKTKHKFILLKDGGAIQVTVNDAKDKETLEKVRKHLSEIPKMFSEGDFKLPLATHGREPTGVPIMKKLKDEIEYKFEEIENGGRVRISTKNAEALDAVHKFLKFQIEDHHTGNSTEVSESLD